jgi:hypothetical protein
MLFIATLLVLLSGGGAQAQELRLDAEAITKALTGNTARGVEPGPEFLQYFDTNGVTTYITRSAPPDRGRWRVDEEGLYCSQWRDGGWSCYEVWAAGDHIVWVSPSGTRYPSIMLDGKVTAF